MIELDRTFSQLVSTGHDNKQWSNVIFLKAQEIANYLTEKRKGFDLSKPEVKLEKVDNNVIREKIKIITYANWINNGGSRGSLWYIKKKISKNEQYKIYRKNPILSIEKKVDDSRYNIYKNNI